MLCWPTFPLVSALGSAVDPSGLPYRREMKMASMIALNLSSEPCRLYRESILMPSTDELFDHLDEVAHSLEVGHVVI